MRITKTRDQVNNFERNEAIANFGCNTCPCCGNPVWGSLVSRSWIEGFFRTRHMKVNCYTCDSCGAQWESDPYEYA